MDSQHVLETIWKPSAAPIASSSSGMVARQLLRGRTASLRDFDDPNTEQSGQGLDKGSRLLDWFKIYRRPPIFGRKDNRLRFSVDFSSIGSALQDQPLSQRSAADLSAPIKRPCWKNLRSFLWMNCERATMPMSRLDALSEHMKRSTWIVEVACHP